MDPLAKQLRTEQSLERKRVETAFRVACQTLARKASDKQLRVHLVTREIWVWLFIPPIFPIPLFFRRRVIIDVELLWSQSSLRLATNGQLVTGPGHVLWFWTKNLRPLRYYSNDDLIQMTHKMRSLYE
jgi:hypothetical protein